MKAFIITDKNQPSCSHEIHVILAKDKADFEKIATTYLHIDKNTLYKNWAIEEKNNTGVIYTDIY